MKGIKVLCCFVFTFNFCSAQDRVNQLDSLLLHLYNTNQFVGSVLVVENNATLYKKSFGWADYTKKDTLKNTTPINLASISKQFTGTAIMLLMQDGLITLKDPITKFFPELNYDNVTVEHLLHHTSGLKDYESVCAVFNRKGNSISNQEMIQLYTKKQKRLKFTPGDSHEYSNTGYVFLAAIVEQVSNLSFNEFITTRVFNPCQFEDTFVYSIDKQEQYDNIAWSYKPSYKREDKTITGSWANYFDALTGDGAICISINDMEKWTDRLSNSPLVNDSLFKLSLTTGYTNDNKPVGYGFGWDLIDGNYGHTGGWHNYATYYFNDLHANRIYAINMTNNPDNYDAIVMAIREIIEHSKLTYPEPVSSQKRKQKKFEKKYKIKY